MSQQYQKQKLKWKKQGKQEALKEVLGDIINRQCIVCQTPLDMDLKRTNWHIPLCKKHRIEELNKITKAKLEEKK